jgi:hypothetical protein
LWPGGEESQAGDFPGLPIRAIVYYFDRVTREPGASAEPTAPDLRVGSDSMPVDSYFVGTILIAASTLVSMAGLLVVRRLTDVEKLAAAHGISGNFLSIVGTMYAVLLGLIVVDAMGRYQKAALNVEEESNQLADLVYLGGRMPTERQKEIKALAIRYAELVRDREWPAMERGSFDPETREAVLRLMAAVRDWEPSTESEKAVYSAALTAATDLWNARRERLIVCYQGVPALEWFIVVLGAIITIGLTYVFVFEDVRVQLALTSMVTLLIALNVYLIVMFGYPFSGDLRVGPESFQATLSIFAGTGAASDWTGTRQPATPPDSSVPSPRTSKSRQSPGQR